MTSGLQPGASHLSSLSTASTASTGRSARADNAAAGGGCPFHRAAEAGDADGLREVARQTLATRMFGDESAARAEEVLVRALQLDPADAQGDTNTLLGQVYFQMERWGDAVKHLEAALSRAPEREDAKQLLERAQTNVVTRVDRPMGPMDAFDPQALRSPPAQYLRAPDGFEPPPPPKRGVGQRLSDGVKKLGGKLLGTAAEGAIRGAGALGTHDGVWTTWDEAPGLLGSLKLAHMRNWLNENTLEAPNPGDLVNGQPAGQRRPEWTKYFRTANGSWNTDDPMEGAAGTPLPRLGKATENRRSRVNDPDLPNAAEVAAALLAPDGPRKQVPFLNGLVMPWVQQMLVHDLVNHRPSTENGFHEIPLPENDPRRQRYGVESLRVPANSPNPLNETGSDYLNEVTPWWDASPIYGSDQATQDRLRTGPDGRLLPDGKLRIDGDLIPVSPETGIEDVGMSRNWWLGPNLFQVLFIKHHNHVCDVLKEAHPDWSSDHLFNVARLVVAATILKIHTAEWTPAVLPNPKLVRGMGANTWGLLETMRKPFGERRIERTFEPEHPVVGGLLGGARENFGEAYAIPEDFPEVYRPLHAGLPDSIEIRPIGADAPTTQVPMDRTRGAGSRELVKEHGLGTLFHSLATQRMFALVNNNYPNFLLDLSLEGQPVADLGTIDIVRPRERGIEPYNEFRVSKGLQPVPSFEALGCSPETVAKLEALYGKGREGIDKMDLHVGMLAEAERPEFFGFGETMFQVFIAVASRRIHADPFFTEKFTEQYYSKEGMALIEQATMKDLLLQHIPELRDSGLVNVKNAFEPWDTTAESHPEEHPLTVFGEQY